MSDTNSEAGAEATDEAKEAYGFDEDPETVERELIRLRMLAEARDPSTFTTLERTGIGEGWHCLEIGAGAGTVSAWMADKVGPTGKILSTDIDLRFHGEMPDNVMVRQHDITADSLKAEHFDLIHARAVFQHIPGRGEAIDKAIAALKPGGWLVIEDGHFEPFKDQTLPDPFGQLHGVMTSAARHDWEPHLGPKLLGMFAERGLVELDTTGEIWPMRGGEASGEWWFLAIEHTAPLLIEHGVFDQETVDAALAQARTPGFVMSSPLSVAALGRKPT